MNQEELEMVERVADTLSGTARQLDEIRTTLEQLEETLAKYSSAGLTKKKVIIPGAAYATERARRIIGNPIRFLPQEGKKVNGYWVIKAIIGVLDDIFVTVEIPEKLLETKEG